MNYTRFVFWSFIALAVVVLYGLIDYFVLGVLIIPGPLGVLIRGAGFIGCQLFVVGVFMNRGLRDLSAQRAILSSRSSGSVFEGIPAGKGGPYQGSFRFVCQRRYVMEGWATTLAPLAVIAISAYRHPENSVNVFLVSMIFCACVLSAVTRSRWTFVITKSGFEWGGLLKSYLHFSDVERVYVNNAYVKPILVIEQKGTIRKVAFGAKAVENFDEFARVTIQAWRSLSPALTL